MKMTVMAYAYPVILHKVVQEQLRKHYSDDTIKDLLKRVRNEYKSILRRAADIGGSKNLFIGSYLLGAYLVSLYKNTKSELSLTDLDSLIANGLENFQFMKKQMSKVDLLSHNYKNKIAQAGQWCKRNEDRFPNNWQVEVKDPENPDATHIVFTKCALCVLCKNEGVPEFLPSLCATDYTTMSFAKCNLERPTTLSKGDASCDFYITRM